MTTYLTHYIEQNGSQVKVAEYALKNAEAADRMEQSIRASYPQDRATFERRTVEHLTRRHRKIRLGRTAAP